MKTILAQGHIKFRSFSLKVLKFAEFLILRPSLFHSEEKNEFLCLTFIVFYCLYFMSFYVLHVLLLLGDAIANPGIVTSVKIRY